MSDYNEVEEKKPSKPSSSSTTSASFSSSLDPSSPLDFGLNAPAELESAMRLKTIQYFLKKRPWLGDNFFKTAATLTIEVVCSKSYEDMTEKLRDVEAQILRKRNELRQFETDYQKVLACFREVTNRYSQKKQPVDELLKQQDNIHSSFTIT